MRGGTRGRLQRRSEEDASAPRRAPPSLADIEAALAPAAAFDPARSAVTFAVAAIDYAELFVLPELIARLTREAPRVRLAMRAMGTALPAADLESGKLDATLGFRAE